MKWAEFVLRESSVMAEACMISYSWPPPMGYWPVCCSEFLLSSAVLPGSAVANSSMPWPACWEQRPLGSSVQISSRMATGTNLLLWHPSVIQVLFFILLFPVFALPCQRIVALAESSILGNYFRYSLPRDPDLRFLLKLVPEKNLRKGRWGFFGFGIGTLMVMFAGSLCLPCEISGQSNKELISLGTAVPIVSTQLACFSLEKPKNISSRFLWQVSPKANWTWTLSVLFFLFWKLFQWTK